MVVSASHEVAVLLMLPASNPPTLDLSVFDARTGQLLWTTTLPGVDGRLAVTGQNQLIALLKNGPSSYLYTISGISLAFFSMYCLSSTFSLSPFFAFFFLIFVLPSFSTTSPPSISLRLNTNTYTYIA